MDEVAGGRRRSFKELLGSLKGISCCGAACTTTTQPEDEVTHSLANDTTHPLECAMTMNLAAALAAERELRAREVNNFVGESPRRMSLMRLLAEPVGGGGEPAGAAIGDESSGVVCCVCMVRKKGAAFIPCGHTYCRVCSRELWLNRASCPLCNRPIAEILHIF